jgi:diadenosine tetraphosphate (Ap4A) HIT family hydrolase
VFTLHQRLDQDTVLLCDWTLCQVLLMNDCRFPWLILVPKRDPIKEIHDLAGDDQRLLWLEITRASEALHRSTRADKMNVGALGNLVPQLHIHVIARFESDAAWPNPVWGYGKAQAYASHDLEIMIEKCAYAFSQLPEA